MRSRKRSQTCGGTSRSGCPAARGASRVARSRRSPACPRAAARRPPASRRARHDSASCVTCASSRTSPTSRPSSVRASVVLPALVCEIRDSATVTPIRVLAGAPATRAGASNCFSTAARSGAARSTNTGATSAVGEDVAPRGAALLETLAVPGLRARNAASSITPSTGRRRRIASTNLPCASRSGVAARLKSAISGGPLRRERAGPRVLLAVAHGHRHVHRDCRRTCVRAAGAACQAAARPRSCTAPPSRPGRP